jgi:hypothetical protein
MLKAQTVSVKSAPKLDAEALQGKWLIGTLHHDKGKTEFSRSYFGMAGPRGGKPTA